MDVLKATGFVPRDSLLEFALYLLDTNDELAVLRHCLDSVKPLIASTSAASAAASASPMSPTAAVNAGSASAASSASISVSDSSAAAPVSSPASN